MQDLSPTRARALSVSILMFVIVIALFGMLLLVELFGSLALQSGSGFGFILIKLVAVILGIFMLLKVRKDVVELYSDHKSVKK